MNKLEDCDAVYIYEDNDGRRAVLFSGGLAVAWHNIKTEEICIRNS